MWLIVAVDVVMKRDVPGDFAEDALYKKVGDDVVLLPRFLPQAVSSITWKDGFNIASQWDGNDIDYYRHYKGEHR